MRSSGSHLTSMQNLILDDPPVGRTPVTHESEQLLPLHSPGDVWWLIIESDPPPAPHAGFSATRYKNSLPVVITSVILLANRQS